MVYNGGGSVAVNRKQALTDNAPILTSLLTPRINIYLHVFEEILFLIFKHTPDMIGGPSAVHTFGLIEADSNHAHTTSAAGAGQLTGPS